jgi:hypothetical protein
MLLVYGSKIGRVGFGDYLNLCRSMDLICHLRSMSSGDRKWVDSSELNCHLSVSAHMHLIYLRAGFFDP